jgi:hypothetical protein
MNFNTILFILRDSIDNIVLALRSGYPRSRGSMHGQVSFFCTSKGSGAHPAHVFNGLPRFFPGDKATGA